MPGSRVSRASRCHPLAPAAGLGQPPLSAIGGLADGGPEGAAAFCRSALPARGAAPPGSPREGCVPGGICPALSGGQVRLCCRGLSVGQVSSLAWEGGLAQLQRVGREQHWLPCRCSEQGSKGAGAGAKGQTNPAQQPPRCGWWRPRLPRCTAMNGPVLAAPGTRQRCMLGPELSTATSAPESGAGGAAPWGRGGGSWRQPGSWHWGEGRCDSSPDAWSWPDTRSL